MARIKDTPSDTAEMVELTDEQTAGVARERAALAGVDVNSDQAIIDARSDPSTTTDIDAAIWRSALEHELDGYRLRRQLAGLGG